jgi:hypothetical protein
MSQIEPTTEQIEERSFTFYMLPPQQSNDLFMDVFKMAGPALGPVIEAVAKANSLDEEIDSKFFARAAAALFGGIDKVVVNRVIEAFKNVSEADGVPLKTNFDIVFLGNLGLMYKWLFFGMKVQWGKSFTALGSAVLQGGLAEAFKSQKL